MLSLAELDIARSLVPIIGSYDRGAFGVICYPWQKSRLPILHQVTTVHCTCVHTVNVVLCTLQYTHVLSDMYSCKTEACAELNVQNG